MKYYLQFNGEYSGTGFIIDSKDAATMLTILERAPRASTKYNQDKHHMEYVLEKDRLPSITGIPIEHVILPSVSIRDTVAVINTYPALIKEIQKAQQAIKDAEEADILEAQRQQEAASQATATTNDVPF